MVRSVHVLLITFVLLLGIAGFAAEITPSGALVPQNAMDIDEVVRRKLYPGGVDEGQLEVQTKAPNPSSQANLHSLRAEVLEEVTEAQETDDSGEPAEIEDAEADLAD